MKTPAYYAGYVIGFVKGYFNGQRDIRKLMTLIKQHGSLGNVPTRDLKKLGRISQEAVRRQKLFNATLVLAELTRSYLGKELTYTVEVVSDYIDFKDLTEGRKERLNAIADSDSVLYALASFAADFGDINVGDLRLKMEEKGVLHCWYLYKDNVLLAVT